MRIRVEIDQLVLHGFNNHDLGQVDQALKNELTRLIAYDGLKNIGRKMGEGKINRADAGSFNLAFGHRRHELVGINIAKSIYKVLDGIQ